MKKILFLIFIFHLSFPVCANQIYDAEWCQKNGGTIEFDTNYNINFNCTTLSVFSISYIEKIYNIVCIPCYSSILKNKEPLFLKLVGETENTASTMFDKYNFKMTESDLVRYI